MNGSLAATLLLALPFSTAAFSADEQQTYRTEPRLLASAPGLGEWVPDLVLTDAAGGTLRLSELMGAKGLVIALREPDCPLSQKYGPRLARLGARESELAELGFGFLLVELAAADVARADTEAAGFTCAVAVDPDLELASALRARTTTETFLLDAARTLRYRGMVDDQYGLGFTRPESEHDYLLEAARAVATEATVATPATEAQGCLLDVDPEDDTSARELTYHNRISRIIQAKCERCHREGAAAPFTLDDYETVKKKRRMIGWTLKDGVMPPWFANEESGPWRNDAGLSEAERADLLAWLEGDLAEGDPADAPLPIQWPGGWTIPEPDHVVEMLEPFQVPAEGVVDYQHFAMPTGLTEDRWVRAVEIQAGAPQVVHHVLAFVESDEDHRARTAAGFSGPPADGSETFFASLVPGQDGLIFPDGLGKRLPANSWIVFQLHYTPNGTAQEDASRIGFVFSDEEHLTEVETSSAVNRGFTIPAGAYDYEVGGEYRFPREATLLSVFPHTHLRGVRFQFDLAYPDGHEESFLELPFYDFNWQLNYELAEPLQVPRGTILRATAWYDNSDTNPANPDPTVPVSFGEQTFDEMMIGYVNWIPTRDAGN